MPWLLLLFLAAQFDPVFREGLVALNQNDLVQAESKLQSAAGLQPQNPRVWLALAQTYWKLHKTSQLQAAARNAESHTADDAVVLRGLAFLYAETGDAAGEARMLKSAGLDEAAYFDLAQVHLRAQNFAAALQTLDAARAKFPSSAQLALAAGVAYYGLRRFPEAIDAFLRTIEIDPAVDQPYTFLGRMADQAEDRLPRVTEAFAAFHKRAPENYLAAFLYGKALALSNDDASAEPLLRESIGRSAGFWEAHFELGVLLARVHRFEDAAAELRRAADLNASDPAPHYHLARVYDRLGKPAEAAAERQIHARLTGASSSAGTPSPRR